MTAQLQSTMIDGRGAAAIAPALPSDFPGRIDALKEIYGGSWDEFGDRMGVDPRQISRWRKGVEPSGASLWALFRFARAIPGGLSLLLQDAP